MHKSFKIRYKKELLTQIVQPVQISIGSYLRGCNSSEVLKHKKNWYNFHNVFNRFFLTWTKETQYLKKHVQCLQE